MATPPPRSLPALAALLALLAGCAPSGSFPSLAVRPVERQGDAPPVAAVVAEVPADPALTARIAELLGAARGGEAAFRQALPAAQRAAAAAGASGSDSWMEAQQAISRLEALRAPTVTALAELDALGVARGSQGVNGDDYRALLAAAEEAGRLASAQRADIDRLNGAMRAP